MMIKPTMRRAFAITATTNTAEQKNPGIVLMINFTLEECAKIVTLTCTTRKSEKRITLMTKESTQRLK